VLILALPFLMEALLSAIIPSSTNQINTIKGLKSDSGSYLLDTANYSTQTVPYYINAAPNYNMIQSMIKSYYSNDSGISLSQQSNDTVNEYVLSLRNLDLNNLISNYFVGFSINQTSAVIYWNSMVFHSSANILNDVDNFLLNLITNNPSRSISTINKPISANSSLDSAGSYLEVLACIDSLPLTLLNFLNGIIVALMIGLMVVHVGRERSNGSKQLQFLSGTHYFTYWFTNYLFDLIVYVFNISTMIIALKIVNAAKNDPSDEVYTIASDNTLGYLYLLMLISSFSWCTYAYIWSFFFKSEIVGFVVLAIFLGFMAFLDVIWIFVQLLIQSGSTTSTPGSSLMRALRLIFALLFPNVTIKRGMYNLKIKNNDYCIQYVNQYLAGNLKRILLLKRKLLLLNM
jgi:hypothetical protein